MRNSQRRILAIAAVVLALSCPIGPACATQLTGSLVTTGLQGLQGFLFFDFLGTVPPGPDNTVQLDFPFGGDGVVNGTSTAGNVAGTGPWTFSLGPTLGPPFNEVEVDYTFGTLFTFSFTTTDILPPLDSPQGFSLFVEYVDDSGNLVPLNTSDLCGDALFVYSIGQGSDALQVCQPTEVSGVSITVAQAPEPNPLALLAIGVVALAWRRMPRLVSTRLPRQLRVDAA